MTLCWFARFFDDPCAGRIDRCHVGFTKQYLRRRGLSEVEVWDPRIWRLGCRLHHDRFDGPWFKLRRDQIPEPVEQYARQHFLTQRLDRDFGTTQLPEPA